MIVQKALTMAEMMSVPVLGLVENFSYFVCPDCGHRHHVFGESHIEAVAEKNGTRVLARLPFDSTVSALCDKGEAEKLDTSAMESACDSIIGS